jgi:two-component system, NarL family, nitrate/nitrite response regulator NarL
MMPASVFLVSDSTIFALTMEQAIRNEFAQVARRSSLRDLDDLALDWRDTVAIIDAANPKDLVAQLNCGNIDGSRLIVLMRANQSVDNYRAIIGDVGALLPDGVTLQEIALAARIVRHGITLLPTAALAGLRVSEAIGVAPARASDERSFTDREHAVLELISEGASNKVIGRKLDITESTVRVHVRAILKKLGMQNRTQAALYAVGHRRTDIGLDLLRPATTMISAAVGFLLLNWRIYVPELAETLLKVPAIV